QRAYVQDETNEYEEYFATQNAQIERAQQVMTGDYEDSVFTDVDDYESISPQQSQAYSYSNSNGSWGSQPTNVSINYYSTGWYYSNPYLYGYAYNTPWAWGYNRPYYSYGYGWNSPFFRFGFGFMGYGGFYSNPYYHYNPYFYGYYNPYYYNNAYYASRYQRSYHNGRRGYRNGNVSRSNRTAYNN